MNTQQPKALQFADEIFKKFPYYEKGHQWSAELRRLHSVNAQLLEALKKRKGVDWAYVQLTVTDMDSDTHERLLEEIDEAENAAKALSSAAIARAESNATS
jgi:hypothetical protein